VSASRPKRTIRILVADAQPLLRDGLKRLLDDEPDMTVVARTGDGAEVVRLADAERPHIALVDLALPGAAGLDVLEKLAEAGPDTRVLLLAAAIREHELLEALRLGARGVVLKDAPTEMLLKAIRVVHDGQFWFNRSSLARLIQFLRARFPEGGEGGDQRPAMQLTAREREVVALIGGGASNREIASQLGVSVVTVKHHLTHVFDKLGVSNRLELAVYAMNRGLVEKDR